MIKVQRTDKFADLSSELMKGTSDLSLLSPTVAHESEMRFTHPFISSPFAIITNKGLHAPASLQELRGKRVAVPADSAEREVLRSYPDIEVVTGATVLEAMAMVAGGQADAMLTTLHSARYYIAHLYEDRLQITNIIGNNKGFYPLLRGAPTPNWSRYLIKHCSVFRPMILTSYSIDGVRSQRFPG